MIKSYRKKPIEIQAIKFEYSEQGIKDLVMFCGHKIKWIKKAKHSEAIGECCITTLEDGVDDQVDHIATEGDYIIRGIMGEFYPCKPNIFKITYEEI